MTADTYSNALGFLIMGTGNDNNAWGTNANNAVFQIFEDAIAGALSSAVTGGTLDLSGTPPPAGPSQARYGILIFTGTLTSNQTILVPNLTKKWTILNNTSGAFQLLFQTSGGTPVNIPQGSTKDVWCDGNNGMYRSDRDDVGQIECYAQGTMPAGKLACDGTTTYLIASFPDLYAKIGTTYGGNGITTFGVPLYTDTNRFLRAAGGSLTVGTYQANTVGPHTHTATASTTVTINAAGDHTHTGSGTTSGQSADHSHLEALIFVKVGGNAGTQFNVLGPDAPGAIGNFQPSTGGSSNDHTHTYSFTTSTAGNHTHTNSASTTVTVNANSGTETRPESAVVLMGIRF